jgi:NADPH2:quinone reductase
MRAITISEFGGPEVLKAVEMAKPAVGPMDLLIEVYATAMNPVDTKVRKGLHGPKNFPLVLGFDVSGVVAAVGEKVRGFKVGDEVFASPSLARNGANAEFVAVDFRTAAMKPRNLDHLHAAALPLVTLTAWEALYERAAIAAGETVLIQAGAGGVGHVALQLAKLRGCRVVTTASRPETIALCQELGADVVIDHKKEDFAAAVMKLTEGKGCPVVFDTVGEPVFDKCLDCVAVNGRLVTIVFNENKRVMPALFRKNATLHMEFMGAPGVHGINLEKHGAILRKAAALAETGKLRPHIGKVIGLDGLAAAHAEQQGGGVIGKIVVKVK